MRKKIIIIFIMSVVYTYLYSEQYINPDNPGWSTIDSIVVGAKDSNGLRLPTIYKLIKTKPNSFLYIAQNTLQYPDYFYLRGSSDNGDSWSNIYVDSLSSTQYKVLSRLDLTYKNNILLLSGENNRIFRSEDYGKSFNVIDIEGKAKMDLLDIDMINNIALTQFSGTLYKSNDKGKSWSYLDITIDTTLFLPLEFSMITDSIYFVRAIPDLNDRYSFLMSLDAGLTWSEVYKIGKKSDTIFSKFKFIDKNVGYSILNKQSKNLSYSYITLIKTTDGGKSWNSIYVDKDSTFGSVRNLYYFHNQLVFHSKNTVFYFSDEKFVFKHSLTFDGKREFLRFINDILITDEDEILIAYDKRICKWSPKTDITQIEKSYFSISPNPASDYITIQNVIPAKAGIYVEIFNILGEKVQQTSLSVNTSQTGMSDQLKIDISNLAPGVYFVKIGDRFEKFVKW